MSRPNLTPGDLPNCPTQETLLSLLEGTLEVTEFEPDRRLTIRGAFGPLSGQATYVLEPAGDVTNLTNAMDLNAKGALRLVAPLATGRVSAAVAENLTKLKEILERRAD